MVALVFITTCLIFGIYAKYASIADKDNGAMQKLDDGSVRITLTGDDDFYVLPANSPIHTYTLTGDWPNQTDKAYYATLQVIATPIT